MKNTNLTFFDVLTAHSSIFPLMEAQDYIKLAFQSEFGCGHLLTDRADAACFLDYEYNLVTADRNEPLYIEIGGGYSRLNLKAAKGILPPDVIFKMFEKSAAPIGTNESYQRKINGILLAARRGVIPVSPESVSEYMRENEFSHPHHSDTFKNKYGANYRVVKTEYAALAPLCGLICKVLGEKGSAVIAIDGGAASGKTTAGNLLSELFDANIIHMDDYFLPISSKTPKRLSLPGGNIDSERFAAEIIAHLKDEKLCRRAFDCHTQKLLPPVIINKTKVTVIEGVYSLLPQFRGHYDVKAFFSTDSESQKNRIFERDGGSLLEKYKSEWLPLEEKYFTELQPRLCCDIIIET